MIKEYDPNQSFGKTTMALTYMMWDYSGTFEVTMGGNCKGFNIMDAAIVQHADDLYDAQGENPVLILRRGEDTLECSPDDEDMEAWLGRMCVGIAIVGFQPDAPAAASTKESA